MKLIEHNKAQYLLFCVDIAFPKRHKLLSHQSVVKHLEVGEQYVGHRVDDSITVLYDVVFTHVPRIVLGIYAFTHEQSGGYLSL